MFLNIFESLQGEQTNMAPSSDGTQYNFDPNADKLPMNSFNF